MSIFWLVKCAITSVYWWLFSVQQTTSIGVATIRQEEDVFGDIKMNVLHLWLVISERERFDFKVRDLRFDSILIIAIRFNEMQDLT